MASRMTHKDFVSKLKDVTPSISVLSEYCNCRTKVLVECDVCKYQWETRSSDLLRGHGCPRCSGKERKSTDRFREEVAAVNPNVDVLGEYKNTSKKIETRCKQCGFIWMANPSTLLSGNGCPSCGGTRKKTADEFEKELYKINSDIVVIGEYKNNRTRIMVECKRCGHQWEATPHNLLDARSRCPKCTHASTSFVEQFIFEWLSRVLGQDSVISRDTKTIGQELDVFIPSLNLAFEPGAWHWHKQKLEIDRQKKECCKQKGIRLIRIYDKVPEEEYFLEDDVYLYPYDIRVKKKSRELEKLLLNILREENISIDINTINLEDVVTAAYSKSVKTNTDEFIEKLRRKGIDVEVIGEYKSSSSRIRVRCKKCGHVWEPQADTLLSGGSRCCICGIEKNGKAHLKSQERYIAEVSENNPDIIVVGKYTKAIEKIHVKCRKCGFEWDPIARRLIGKNVPNCPKCRIKYRTRGK